MGRYTGDRYSCERLCDGPVVSGLRECQMCEECLVLLHPKILKEFREDVERGECCEYCGATWNIKCNCWLGPDPCECKKCLHWAKWNAPFDPRNN